jgi:hypothetical protein
MTVDELLEEPLPQASWILGGSGSRREEEKEEKEEREASR